MAMILCRECDETVSSHAKTCPHCGIKKPYKKKSSTITNVFMFLFFASLFSIGLNLDEPKNKSGDPSSVKKAKIETSWEDEDNGFMAYSMIEDFVKRRLKSPASAEFPGIFDGQKSHIKKLIGMKYRINSYVDSQNSFGAVLRNRFTGIMEQTSEYEWRLVSLEME